MPAPREPDRTKLDPARYGRIEINDLGTASFLPGCAGTTYNACFEPLRTNGPPRNGTKVYYDLVSFKTTKIPKETVLIDVALGVTAYTADKDGKYNAVGLYKVRIDMRAWTTRRRLGFIRDVKGAMHRQRELKDRGSTESVLLFFLGAPDPNDATLFHVADGRLVCFLKGKQPARQRRRLNPG